MFRFNVNDKIDIESENGIWADFSDHTWYIYVKDDEWTKEEVDHINQKGVHLALIQKGVVDAFLIDVYDMMETSDIPFCVSDASKDLYNSFKDSLPYHVTVLFLNKDNVIQAKREGDFTKENSMAIKKALQVQKTNAYDASVFTTSYTKMCKKYQPYELEEFIYVKQAF